MRGVAGGVLLSLALAACSPEERAETLPPLDRFYYPTGVAATRLPAGSPLNTALLVASSNFDLRYSSTGGGTLLSVRPDTSAWNAPRSAYDVPLDLRGAERIGSFAGSVAVADAKSCATLPSPVALVASRFDGVLYRFGIGVTAATAGQLSCGAGCVVGLDPALRDPYDVSVACGPAGHRAYVGHLHPPRAASGYGYGAWLSEVDLDSGAARSLEIGDGPVRSTAYEPAQDRLWIAARPAGARALLYSAIVSDPLWGTFPSLAVDVVDLYPSVRGLELRSLAVGTPIAGKSRRLYATGRIFDADAIAADGSHPSGDVGGVLLVLDVADDASGRPIVAVRRVVSIGTSVGDVAVVSRATTTGTSQRDVVIATALDGDLLYVWDDEAEAIALVIGRDRQGLPLLGNRPMALAIDQPPPGAVASPATVYVGAFGSSSVASFVLDPATPWTRGPVMHIGGMQP